MPTSAMGFAKVASEDGDDEIMFGGYTQGGALGQKPGEIVATEHEYGESQRAKICKMAVSCGNPVRLDVRVEQHRYRKAR
jgi:hypothetical protein